MGRPRNTALRLINEVRQLRAIKLAAALFTVLTILSCAPERPLSESGVLVITEAEPAASFIRNFNPFFEWGDVRWPARRSMYEPMMLFNVLTGEFVPCLAKDYRWTEGNRVNHCK